VSINLSDKIPGSSYFTWKEALWLPRWNMAYIPDQATLDNIIELARRMDAVRVLVGKPINVTVWLRPNVPGKGDYNALIGGASNSSHKTGQAVDFGVNGLTVDQVLDIVQPKLMGLQLSAENNGSIDRIAKNGGSGGPRNWIHLQSRPLSGSVPWRIFNP
jgi:hypothetical protein